MKERVENGRYDEGDLRGLLRRQDSVDLKKMVADVSETYSFLRNVTEDERLLAVDQHKREEGRYEACRSAAREMDPVNAEPSSADVKAIGL